MYENTVRKQECEEPAEQPFPARHREEPKRRAIRWPWKGIQVSVFWNFGIRIIRPKRMVTPRAPTLVQGADVKAMTRGQESPA